MRGNAGCLSRALLLAALLLLTPGTQAHHSYAGYDPDAPVVFEGELIAVQWVNPHILFTVDDGSTPMHIEWVTIAGADKTNVALDRFHIGERMRVVGSRHQNPDIHTMTIVKELALPAQQWRWISPSVRNQSP